MKAFKISGNNPQILRYSIAGNSFYQKDVSFPLPTLDSLNKRSKWRQEFYQEQIHWE